MVAGAATAGQAGLQLWHQVIGFQIDVVIVDAGPQAPADGTLHGKAPEGDIDSARESGEETGYEKVRGIGTDEAGAPDLVAIGHWQTWQETGIAPVSFARRTGLLLGVDSLHADGTDQPSDLIGADGIARAARISVHIGQAIERRAQELLVDGAQPAQVQSRRSTVRCFSWIERGSLLFQPLKFHVEAADPLLEFWLVGLPLPLSARGSAGVEFGVRVRV